MRAASIPARAASVTPLRSRRLLALSGDARLVEQVRRGNDAAFEVVFERHGPAILGFCRHMLGSREEAEDVVQHTFAAAYRVLQGDGEREIALKPWLFAIARNRCVSVLRARREVPSGTETLEARLPSGSGLTEQVEERADLQRLLADLRELPDQQRAALLLSELGELSHAEVASVLDCEVSRVKGLVFRARSALIARRDAREAPCERIREQLANLRGGALRRSELRLHLRECPGCREYREKVKQQRRMLAVALPVAPSLGLKTSVLAAIGIGGGSAGGLSTAAGVFGGSTVAKVAVAGMLAGGGVVTGEAVIDSDRPAVTPPAPAQAAEGGRSGAAGRAAAPVTGPGSDGGAGRSAHEAGALPGARTGGEGQEQGGDRMTLGRGGERSGRGGERSGLGRGAERMAQGSPRMGENHSGKGEERGRGPIEAPPKSTPVRRGPPAESAPGRGGPPANTTRGGRGPAAKDGPRSRGAPARPEPWRNAQPRGHARQAPGSRAGAKPSPPANARPKLAKPKTGPWANGGGKSPSSAPQPLDGASAKPDAAPPAAPTGNAKPDTL
ncbi:MAG TPA: sigma-70 family RNA polymerase sigma factor [Thermoleophilaceae bacterium]|nr:sigma-70 family RNA polymerase sigma factor [Thermoleophilaceae bacterium]